VSNVLYALRAQHWSLSNPGGDSTAASFVSRIPTTTKPPANAVAASGLAVIGDGVIAVGTEGSYAPICLQLVGIGQAATNTFKTNVYGWLDTSQFGNAENGLAAAPTNPVSLWTPILLATYTWTLGTASGVANSDIGASEVFATSVLQTYGPVYGTGPAQSMQIAYAGGGQIYSPGSNAIAMVELLTEGFSYLEVTFNMNSSASSANCLYRKK
jgi:hypothetical protein